MLGIYFSGTGNSRYALELFLKKYDGEARAFSIEDQNAVNAIKETGELVFCYPVQYSNIPRLVKDFIDQNGILWRGKKVFVIATMGLFSGDGAGILARRLRKYGASVTGGLHLKMPDSIADEKALKRPLEKNRALVRAAEKKDGKCGTEHEKRKAAQGGNRLLVSSGGIIRTAALFLQ